MHLRLPAIDHGIISFLWALFFGLFIWIGGSSRRLRQRRDVHRRRRRRLPDLRLRACLRRRRAAPALRAREREHAASRPGCRRAPQRGARTRSGDALRTHCSARAAAQGRATGASRVWSTCIGYRRCTISQDPWREGKESAPRCRRQRQREVTHDDVRRRQAQKGAVPLPRFAADQECTDTYRRCCRESRSAAKTGA